MKRALLATLFSLIAILAIALSHSSGNSGLTPLPPDSYEQPNISIYPNPATNYISIDNDENVKSITVFNLVGRKLKSFQDVHKNEHYDVSNLPKGMYLVRVTDFSNKIITTQRISKR